MATTYYYVPPQYIYPYTSTDAPVAQSWVVDDNTIGFQLTNGLISEADVSGSLTKSTVVYMTTTRTYLPGETYLASQTTGLAIPITAGITQKEADGIAASQPLYVVGTNQDDIWTIDPYSASSLRFTNNGFLQNIKEFDAKGGEDVLKVEDTYASGKYSISRNSDGEIVATANHLNQVPIVLKNFEYVSFKDLGLKSLDFLVPPATATTPVSSSSSGSNGGVAGNTLDVIVNLFGTVSMLKGLIEVNNGTVHTLSYNGTVFNYAEIDPLITTVVRNGEFTAEFAQEIADAYPSAAGIKYNTVVSLVGAAAIDDLLMSVAGSDGSYVS